MKRTVSHRLEPWLQHQGRRPLILRGARQVGKTWLVRDLAGRTGRQLIELNFEREPGLGRHFASHQPRRILGELALALQREIVPERALLFLDEIQAQGELLTALRWFFEDMPDLPVIAAGSLLEFTLREHDFSMPVGRAGFLHIEPLGFQEYLLAHEQQLLLSALTAWRPGQEFSTAAHEQATVWLHRYLQVGGMPAVVAIDVAGRGPAAVREAQKDLVATYRADFAAYSGRMDRHILDHVLIACVRALGQKFVYGKVGDGVRHEQAKRALELLSMAKLVHLVRGTAANGLPLGGEVKGGFTKALLADIGIAHALLGTPAGTVFPQWEDLSALVRGQLTDQMVGQQLRLLGDGIGDGPELFYWQREGGRPGEIDYLVQQAGRIIPVECKAGASGSMKSLHQFMFDKRLDCAVRCDANPPSLQNLALKTTQGDAVKYRLLNIPPYLVWNLQEILAAAKGAP